MKPDRIMIFYETHDTEWITLRVSLFHYTLFKTDVLDLLDIVGVDVPGWLDYILGKAIDLESRPIPEAPFPQSLPSLATIRAAIPGIIDNDMAFPVFSGGQIGGLAVNPGGDVVTQQIPYRARLCAWTYKGLNFWLQGGMLNGAACLVSQALLHYRKATEPKILPPIIDLTGYLQGKTFGRGKVWYIPGLEAQGTGKHETIFAHNEVIYSGGNYSYDRYFFLDCPVPEYPSGHFVRPEPGMKLKISCVPGVLGRWRVLLEDDYTQGDGDNTVPYGCVPGWPDDSFLATYGLYNDDSVGINSFSSVVKVPELNVFFAERGTDNAVLYDVVVDETDSPAERVESSVGEKVLLFYTLLKSRKYSFGGSNNMPVYQRSLSLNGEPLTIAGRTLEV